MGMAPPSTIGISSERTIGVSHGSFDEDSEEQPASLSSEECMSRNLAAYRA
jgi:hypothetical protein